MTTTLERRPTAAPTRTPVRLYTALVGLAALAILLQGLWAGIFLAKKGSSSESWVEVHARGGEVALALAALATVVAFVCLRRRKDLLFGALALTVLLAFEGWLGGLIHDDGKNSLTAVHVPLALALMALAVWLPVHAVRAARLARR